MFVSAEHLDRSWELQDAGVPIAEIEHLCGGEEIKERLWKKVHEGCTTCARGEVHRTGGSGEALVVTAGLVGELPTTSEVPVRGIARNTKRPAREAIPAGRERE